MATTQLSDYMLYVGTHGMEDPTRAGLIFSAANAARQRKYNAVVALLGDAIFLMNDRIAQETKPMGRANLYDLIKQAVAGGVEIYC
jgi:predicted peroxiredoxin